MDLEPLAHAVKLMHRHLERAEPWRKDALCREHPDANWFPSKGESTIETKSLCGRCLVVRECRESAVAAGQQLLGIWGGQSRRERRKVKLQDAA